MIPASRDRHELAEGQNNGVTVVFKIDRPTGGLTKTDITLDTPAPVHRIRVVAGDDGVARISAKHTVISEST